MEHNSQFINFKHFVIGMESNIQRPHHITPHQMDSRKGSQTCSAKNGDSHSIEHLNSTFSFGVSHVTMCPDELFLWSCLTLTQPCLSARVEKHQLQQKNSHDWLKPLHTFTSMGQEPEKTQAMGTRPVTHLVQMEGKVWFCHFDHLLTRRLTSTVKPNENNSAS